MIIRPFKRGSDPILTAMALMDAMSEVFLPLDIEEVALSVGIKEICELPDKNLEGMLVADPKKESGIINVGTHILEKSRKRFTIAHELGHFLITTHRGQYKCTALDLNNFSIKKKNYEAEANLFAANLLMPEGDFKKAIQYEDPGKNLIGQLTEMFGTSLTSTLIRYVNLSEFSVAVAFAHDGSVRWTAKSPSFKYFIHGGRLPEDSMAIEHFRGNEVPENFEGIDPNSWIDTTGVRHLITLKELAFAMPRFDSTLSLIWIEEDEEELVDDPIEFNGYLKIKDDR